MSYSRFMIPALALLLAGCSEDPSSSAQVPPPEKSFGKKLQTQLVMAQPGDVIEIPEGFYELDRSLTLSVDGVTIRGAGMDKTILSFKNQVAGAEGMMVTASDFTLEDLAIEDTKGDSIKINQAKNIVIRRVRSEWTNGPSTENGSYGFYPVMTENTLIEDSVVIGASDAGIYVGQSYNVVIRNNRAEYNVAGYEIENTIGADVYNNVATNNTGGVLIFNMPYLTQPGHSTRIYNNEIYSNNTENFAPKGTAVASVPAGSGILINSNDNVEIFGNNLKDNDTANIIVSSLLTADYQEEYKVSDNFDPFPEGIFIYDNTYSGGGTSPGRLELKALKVAQFGLTGRLPDILWDGVINPKHLAAGKTSVETILCIDDAAAGFINVDASNDFKGISTDKSPHNCQMQKMAAIDLGSLDSQQESTQSTLETSDNTSKEG